MNNYPDFLIYIASLFREEVIHAEYDDSEKNLIYLDTIEFSGNSTIYVVVMEQENLMTYRTLFKEMGCDSMQTWDSCFTMNVSYKISYSKIKQKLDELEDLGILGYDETSISPQHDYRR